MFFRTKIPNENKSKPFHANRTDEERRDWFSRTRPWHELPQTTIDTLIEGFRGSELMFEVFVVTSMKANLVKRYAGLGDNSSSVVRAQISQILTDTGSAAIRSIGEMLARARGKESEWRRLFHLARDTLEPAVALEKGQFTAHLYLAQMHQLLGKVEDCHRCALNGLNSLNAIKNEIIGDKSAFDWPTVLGRAEAQLKSLLKWTPDKTPTLSK